MLHLENERFQLQTHVSRYFQHQLLTSLTPTTIPQIQVPNSVLCYTSQYVAKSARPKFHPKRIIF